MLVTAIAILGSSRILGSCPWKVLPRERTIIPLESCKGLQDFLKSHQPIVPFIAPPHTGIPVGRLKG